MERPGVESRWGEIFRTRQTGPGVHSASYTRSTGSFPGAKRPGRGVDHPPPSGAEVKEGVELYFYSPSGFSWPVLGWNYFTLIIIIIIIIIIITVSFIKTLNYFSNGSSRLLWSRRWTFGSTLCNLSTNSINNYVSELSILKDPEDVAKCNRRHWLTAQCPLYQSVTITTNSRPLRT
jgi:hypothetical protein